MNSRKCNRKYTNPFGVGNKIIFNLKIWDKKQRERQTELLINNKEFVTSQKLQTMTCIYPVILTE